MFCIRACIHCTKMTNGLKTGHSPVVQAFQTALQRRRGRSRLCSQCRQWPDLGHAVGHHGGHPGLFQHGAVVFAVAHGKGVPGGCPAGRPGQQGLPLSTPAAVTSMLSGDPCTTSTPGRARKRAAPARPALSKNMQNFSTSWAWRLQPLGLVTHNVIAAIVGLAGLGGKMPFFPGRPAPYPARPDRRTRPKRCSAGRGTPDRRQRLPGQSPAAWGGGGAGPAGGSAAGPHRHSRLYTAPSGSVPISQTAAPLVVMTYRMPGSCATNGGRLARGRPVADAPTRLCPRQLAGRRGCGG